MSSTMQPPNMELDNWHEDPGRWREGDRVFAPQEPGWFYPATVGQIKVGTALLYFDDGKQEKSVLTDLRVIDLFPGQRIFCRSRDNRTYQPAVVRVFEKDRLQIEYEDSEVVWTVTAMVSVFFPAAGGNTSGQPDTHPKNARLEKSSDGNKQSPAVISNIPLEPRKATSTGGVKKRSKKRKEKSLQFATEKVDNEAVGGWRVRDRVLAGMADGWLYPGYVARVDGASILVRFDKGLECWVAAEHVYTMDLDVGSRVAGNWLGGGVYYTGTIKRRKGETVYIHYDDGDKEWTTIGMTRVAGNSTTAAMSSAGTALFGKWGCLIVVVILFLVRILIALGRR